ncbi:hypothetical protein ACLM45_03685 [Synechococcus sp. A10-1-5-9]|uniref:hypothetical protein n=1 Tax=Synechococcus sp. A10-1-5-9 TaxID=3392295 RepID=UPI0039E7448C
MAVKTKTHPVVGPFQRKVATVIKEMESQSVPDAQMTAIELQHEIGFLLRLHQWSENSWQHRQLSALIDELEEAIVGHTTIEKKCRPSGASVEKKVVQVTSRRRMHSEVRVSHGLMVAGLFALTFFFAAAPLAAFVFTAVVIVPTAMVCWFWFL